MNKKIFLTSFIIVSLGTAFTHKVLLNKDFPHIDFENFGHTDYISK